MIFRSFLTHHCTDIETIRFCNREKGPTENSIWILYSWQLVFCDNSFNIQHHHLFSGFTDFIDFLAAWCFGLVNSICHNSQETTSDITDALYPPMQHWRNIKNVTCSFSESRITFSITGQCNSSLVHTHSTPLLCIYGMTKTHKREKPCSCHDLKQLSSGLP